MTQMYVNLVNAMTSFPLVIVKRAQDSVNVGKSLHPLTVMTAVLVIMDIQIVDHVNVTLMVLVALFVNLLEDLALVSKTIKESFARNVKRDIIISQNVCPVNAILKDPLLRNVMQRVASAHAKTTMEAELVMSARMDIPTIQNVAIVIVMCVEQDLVYVINSQEIAYAEKVMLEKDVIDVSQAIMATLIVDLVVVVKLEVHPLYVMHQAGAPVCQAFRVGLAVSAVQVITSILIVYLATVIPTEQLVCLAIMMESASARIILMDIAVSSAKKGFIISQYVKNAIVIPLELLTHFKVVAHCHQVNSVNAKKEFKEEYVINADPCFGICKLQTKTLVKNVNVLSLV